MEHAPKINKVEVRTLQMADYRQLSQSFNHYFPGRAGGYGRG